MNQYGFTMDMAVRDYECDLQGIVNNSVYQNYCEHVRHEYLKSIGVDFAAYAREGINFVVVRAELDYKLPLVSGDVFTVALTMAQESAVKIVFYQDIIRKSDERLILKAKIMGTALNKRGRPELPAEVLVKMGFAQYAG